MSNDTITLPLDEYERMIREIGAATLLFSEIGLETAWVVLAESLDDEIIQFVKIAAKEMFDG